MFFGRVGAAASHRVHAGGGAYTHRLAQVTPRASQRQDMGALPGARRPMGGDAGAGRVSRAGGGRGRGVGRALPGGASPPPGAAASAGAGGRGRRPGVLPRRGDVELAEVLGATGRVLGGGAGA